MDTPLNRAHFFARKAKSAYGKIEAKNYLEKSIENFIAAKQISSSPKALESLDLQKNYYERQLHLINLKKSLFERCEKIQKESTDETSKFDLNENIDNATTLQLDLLQNLSLVDKELEELAKSNPENSNMTEIQNLNSQFNVLLCKLFNLVDVTIRENVALKEGRQEEEIKLPPSTCIDNQVSNSENKIQEVSREQIVSSTSPSGGGDVGGEEEEEICDLPPLEFPVFDL